MSLSPALREVIEAATAKYQVDQEDRRGIIPLGPPPPLELDRRDLAVFIVADMINKALTGPAIGVEELAERIVDEVAEAYAEYGE